MKRMSVFVLVAVLAMVPALACGGDSDDEEPSPTQASGATQPSGQTQASPTRAAAGATAAATSPSIPGVVATIASGSGALAIEACRLFTKEEATTALGESVGDPDGINVGQQAVQPGLNVTISSCSFNSSTGKSVEVTFWRAAGTISPQVRAVYEQFLCDQKEKIQGLGDVACWYDSDRTEITLLKGTTFLDIQLNGVSGRADQLRALAQRALARLQ